MGLRQDPFRKPIHLLLEERWADRTASEVRSVDGGQDKRGIGQVEGGASDAHGSQPGSDSKRPRLGRPPKNVPGNPPKMAKPGPKASPPPLGASEPPRMVLDVPRGWDHSHSSLHKYRGQAQLQDRTELGAFKRVRGQARPTTDPPAAVDMAGLSSLVGRDLSGMGVGPWAAPGSYQEFTTQDIMHCLRNAEWEPSRHGVHVVTYRNNLNKIMGTPYQRQEWEMKVLRKEGVLLLEVVNTAPPRPDKFAEGQLMAQRFEDLCTGRNSSEEQQEHCLVSAVQLNGRHKLVVGATVDGCRAGQSEVYVEIKCAKEHERTGRAAETFRRTKLLRFYLQAMLANIQHIVIGWRDNAGVLKEVECLRTEDVPASVNHEWDPNICINFAATLLQFLQDRVKDGKEYVLRHESPWTEVSLHEL